MLRALIIDDEAQSRSSLADYLTRYCQEVELVGEAIRVSDGLEKIRNLQPDLVFLDIEMPDGTGFDLLEQVEEIHFGIIFVTAFDQYALKAFRFSALDYYWMYCYYFGWACPSIGIESRIPWFCLF